MNFDLILVFNVFDENHEVRSKLSWHVRFDRIILMLKLGGSITLTQSPREMMRKYRGVVSLVLLRASMAIISIHVLLSKSMAIVWIITSFSHEEFFNSAFIQIKNKRKF